MTKKDNYVAVSCPQESNSWSASQEPKGSSLPLQEPATASFPVPHKFKPPKHIF
jgi:hypothetical protein